MKSGPAAWYAIQDAISSKIKTGKTPHILDVITIVPIGRVKTTPKFGINLDEEDFATAIINRRIAIEALIELLPEGPERDALEAEQLARKSSRAPPPLASMPKSMSMRGPATILAIPMKSCWKL